MNWNLLGLLEGIEGSSKLLLRLKACVEPINDLSLMFWTGKNSNCSILYGDHGVVWTMWCEVATGTVDTTGWPMVY